MPSGRSQLSLQLAANPPDSSSLPSDPTNSASLSSTNRILSNDPGTTTPKATDQDNPIDAMKINDSAVVGEEKDYERNDETLDGQQINGFSRTTEGRHGTLLPNEHGVEKGKNVVDSINGLSINLDESPNSLLLPNNNSDSNPPSGQATPLASDPSITPHNNKADTAANDLAPSIPIPNAKVPGESPSVATPQNSPSPTSLLSMSPKNMTTHAVNGTRSPDKTLARGPTSNTAATLPLPKGQLHVTLICASGLDVWSKTDSRPYGLLQYDQSESTSKEWGAPNRLPESTGGRGSGSGGKTKLLGGVKRGRGITGGFGVSSNSSSNNSNNTANADITVEKTRSGMGVTASGPRRINIKNVPTSPPGATNSHKVSQAVPTSPTSQTSTAVPSAMPTLMLKSSKGTATPPVSAPESDGQAVSPTSMAGDAANPVWEHDTIFDVVSEKRAVRIAIYDRSTSPNQPPPAPGTVPSDGLLGVVEIIPDLTDGWKSEQTVVLRKTTATDLPAGEIKVKLRFEKVQTKKRLAPEDFDVLKRIGEGSFGQVYRVRKRDTKRVYAMKVLSKKSIMASKGVDHVLSERRVLQRTLNCRFLVGLKFCFQSDQELFFVMDYKSGGELFRHLQRHGGRFEEYRTRFYIGEIVLALEYLHKMDIIYRDLKPENCLLDAAGHVSLCDFGLSKLDVPADGSTKTFCGTSEYLAPEILLDEGYGRMVDFWSLGVLLFEMTCGWSPFYAEERIQKYQNILEMEIKVPTRTLSPEGRDLLLKLLTRDPQARIGFRYGAAEVKQHPFFASTDWRALAAGQVVPPFKPPVNADEEGFDYVSKPAPESHGMGVLKSRRSSVVGEDSGFSSISDSRGGTTSQPFTRSIREKFKDFTFIRQTANYGQSEAGGGASDPKPSAGSRLSRVFEGRLSSGGFETFSGRWADDD